MPPRWVPIARDLGLGRVEGREWIADPGELQAIRAEADRRREAAQEARSRAKRARRRERASAQERSRERAEAAAAEAKAAAEEWERLLASGDREAIEAFARRVAAHPLRLPGGGFAFLVDPIADDALRAAVVAARRMLRAGRPASVAINIAARRAGADPREVARFVGQAGGRAAANKKRGLRSG